MTLDEANDLLWGTYGKDAMENHYLFGKPLPPMRLKRLGDCGDDHLKSILFGQSQITDEYRDAIKMILRDRHSEPEPDTPNRRADAIAATRAKVSEPSADTEVHE